MGTAQPLAHRPQGKATGLGRSVGNDGRDTIVAVRDYAVTTVAS